MFDHNQHKHEAEVVLGKTNFKVTGRYWNAEHQHFVIDLEEH